MSLNIVPLEVYQTIDPILDLQRDRLFGVYNGGKEISYQPFPAQNIGSGNVIQIQHNPRRNYNRGS